MRSASTRVIKSLPPSKRSPLVNTRGHFVFKSVVEGFVDLVCANWTEVPATWPPVTQRRMGASTTGIQLADMSPLTNVHVPESFRLDVRRIKNFNADLIDLAIVHMILAEFARLFELNNPYVGLKHIAAEAKRDIENAFEAHGAYQAFTPMEHGSDISMRLASRIVRAGQPFGDKPPVVPSEDLIRVEALAGAFDHFLSTQIRPDSPMFLSAMMQVRTGLTKSLTHQLVCAPAIGGVEPDISLVEKELASIASPTRGIDTPDSLSPAARRAEYESLVAHLEASGEQVVKINKLDHINEDLKGLAGKMAKIVSFNLNVFIETYLEKGMVIGA